MKLQRPINILAGGVCRRPVCRFKHGAAYKKRPLEENTCPAPPIVAYTNRRADIFAQIQENGPWVSHQLLVALKIQGNRKLTCMRIINASVCGNVIASIRLTDIPTVEIARPEMSFRPFQKLDTPI